jgi:thiol:disulfide interchange protein DsbD
LFFDAVLERISTCILIHAGWWTTSVRGIVQEPKGNFNLVGKAKESKTKTAYNDIFEVNETYF